MNTSETTQEIQAYRALLEELVEQHAYMRVQYYSEINEFFSVKGLMKAIVTKAGQDYLVLATGLEIPISQIVRVGDKPAPGYDTDYFKCDI